MKDYLLNVEDELFVKHKKQISNLVKNILIKYIKQILIDDAYPIIKVKKNRIILVYNDSIKIDRRTYLDEINRNLFKVKTAIIDELSDTLKRISLKNHLFNDNKELIILLFNSFNFDIIYKFGFSGSSVGVYNISVIYKCINDSIIEERYPNIIIDDIAYTFNIFKLLTKPNKGMGFAGIRNEEMLVEAINIFHDSYSEIDNKINIKFIDKTGKIFVIKDIKNAVRYGSQGLKTDVKIYDNNNKEYNISLKKDNAQGWESSDSYLGKLAKLFYNKLKEYNLIRPLREISYIDYLENKLEKIDIKKKKTQKEFKELSKAYKLTIERCALFNLLFSKNYYMNAFDYGKNSRLNILNTILLSHNLQTIDNEISNITKKQEKDLIRFILNHSSNKKSNIFVSIIDEYFMIYKEYLTKKEDAINNYKKLSKKEKLQELNRQRNITSTILGKLYKFLDASKNESGDIEKGIVSGIAFDLNLDSDVSYNVVKKLAFGNNEISTDGKYGCIIVNSFKRDSFLKSNISYNAREYTLKIHVTKIYTNPYEILDDMEHTPCLLVRDCSTRNNLSFGYKGLMVNAVYRKVAQGKNYYFTTISDLKRIGSIEDDFLEELNHLGYTNLDKLLKKNEKLEDKLDYKQFKRDLKVKSVINDIKQENL